MNRFRHNRYCSFPGSLVLALGLFAVATGAGHGQVVARPKPPTQTVLQKGPGGAVISKTRSRDILKKYDLEVKVTGTIDGNNDYLLGCTITNVGQEAYRGGRYLLVLAVSADKKGTILQRREPLPQLLKPGESYTIPTFKVLSRAAPTGRFVLVLTQAGPKNDEDANPRNDRAEIEIIDRVR